MATYTILNKRIREKDLPDFTRQLYKNRQKDRRIKMAQEKKVFEVSKEKFLAYVKVQKCGMTNMFDIKNVIYIADNVYDTELIKEDCLYIMKNYGELLAEYQ